MRAIEMFDEVEGGHCLEHRNLDAASHPRPLALDDRRQYRDRADQPARLVGNDRREIGRSAELSAENVGAAGKALIDIVISRTRSEEHTSELQSLMRNSYAVFCLKKKTKQTLLTYRLKTSKTSH